MIDEQTPAEMPTPDAQPASAPSFGDTFWGGFLQGLFPQLSTLLDSKDPKAAPGPPAHRLTTVEVSPLPLPVRVELPTPLAGPAGSTSFGPFTGSMQPPPLPIVAPPDDMRPAPSLDVSPFTSGPREVPAFAVPDVTPNYSPSADGDRDMMPTFARGAGLLEQLGDRDMRDAIEKLTDAMDSLADQLKKQPAQPQQPGHQPGGGFVPLGMPPASAGAGTPRPIVPTRGMPPASSGLPSPWERAVRGRS